MKIMSFNLRFAHNADHNQQKEREPRVAAFIHQQQPASVGFQETEPFWRERLDEVLAALKKNVFTISSTAVQEGGNVIVLK